MKPNKYYMIPFLSKELDSLGYSKLPFTIQANNCSQDRTNSHENHSNTPDPKNQGDSCSDHSQISFDSNEMISCLISVCDELIKAIKMSNEQDDFSDANDELRFRNCNLQKQVKNLKKDLEGNMKLISELKEKCRQLNVQLDESHHKIKVVEKEKVKISKQSLLNEEIWKIRCRKIEKELLHVQKLMCKEPYLQKCLHMTNSSQPNSIKKLWTDIKCSSTNSKEEALTKAVSAFGENNVLLMEDNTALKTLLLVTIEEINFLFEFISNKTKIPLNKFDEKEMSNILEKTYSGIQPFKDYIWKHLNIFVNLFDLFNEFSFYVGDDLFVCLSDVAEKIKKMTDR